MYLDYESKHYTFHYKSGGQAERDIQAICLSQEECFSNITKTLNVVFPLKIHYWLCDSPEEVGRIYGDNEPCNGFAHDPDTIYAVYNEEIKCIGPHEDAHLISYMIAKPASAFVREGLAMFFDKTWWGEPNEVWVKRFLEERSMPFIKSLLSDDCFFEHDCSITYPIAGAFTKYLIEEYGLASYLKLYKYEGLEWDSAFMDFLGKDIDRTENAFLSHMQKQCS